MAEDKVEFSLSAADSKKLRDAVEADREAAPLEGQRSEAEKVLEALGGELGFDWQSVEFPNAMSPKGAVKFLAAMTAEAAAEADAEDRFAARWADIEKAAQLQNFAPDSLVGGLVHAMIECLRNRPAAWKDMNVSEQRNVVGAFSSAAKTMVVKALTLIAAEDRPMIRARLESYGEKDAGIKAALKIVNFDAKELQQAIVGLHKSVNKDVLIIMADASDYDKNPGTDPIAAEEPELSFESDLNTGASGDVDLADEEEEDIDANEDEDQED